MTLDEMDQQGFAYCTHQALERIGLRMLVALRGSSKAANELPLSRRERWECLPKCNRSRARSGRLQRRVGRRGLNESTPWLKCSGSRAYRNDVGSDTVKGLSQNDTPASSGF